MISTELEIDLSKVKFNFSEIENLDGIATIRFINYIDKIEIPLVINDYPAITKLKFIGKSGKDVFQTPDNLEQFINIRVLIIWNFCGFSGMKPMPLLEEFHTIVENVQKDTREIITLFPNLKNLVVSGPYEALKNQKLPNEIGSLSSLEELYLLSLGLIILPNSFGNLKQLNKLVLKGNTLNGFPEVITQLENLETLEINQKFSKLPDSLLHLKKIKKLHLNTSDTSQSSSGERKIKQTPIPAVVGKLENIEDLDIGLIDLFDIRPILTLKKLKKLGLRNSALKNCDGFSNFSMLEELNLEKSSYLRNLDGLKGLSIKNLNLSSTFIMSVEVISTLESLETLNISRCYSIQDFTPVFVHPAIKELKADDEVLKNWKVKDPESKPVQIDAIISQLATENLQQFEEAILQLSEFVNVNSIRNKNPLAVLFGIKTKDEKITKIEILDNAIQKYLKNLSDKTLIAIFEMTFKSVSYDNYNAALIVLEEIILRKNAETQNQIVNQFYNACEYYDAGHRFWSYTVHDQLIDDLFAQFTSQALYELLKNASTDMLNSEGGDEMEALFIPALENTGDLELQNKILDVFFSYQEEGRTYFDKTYFDELLEQIKEIASPDLLQLILEKKKNVNNDPWAELLEEIKEENLPGIIDRLGSEIPKSIEEKYFNEIVEACTKTELLETSAVKLLTYLIEKDERLYLANFLFSQYHKTSPEKNISFLKTQLQENFLTKIQLWNILDHLISKIVNLNLPLEELKIYEDALVSLCDKNYDQVYSIEISTLLNTFLYYDNYAEDKEKKWAIDNVKTILNKAINEVSYGDLSYKMYGLINSNEYEKVRQLFEVLYPKVKEIKEEDVLYCNIIASLKLKDESYFDSVFNEIQQMKRVTKSDLAFNLACAFAVFERKEQMLFYIKDSIRRRRTAQEFLDCTDFEKYWEDKEFLEAIKKA